LLDEWLSLEVTAGFFAEFFVDRAVLRALRGQFEESEADVDEAARLRAKLTDPQYESYEAHARSWAALAAGDLAAAVGHADRAVAVTGYFAPLALPLGARAALWAGDAAAARRLMDKLAEVSYWGLALEADRVCLGAGIAAVEGRIVDALAGYREALRAYRQLGLAFDEALAGIDMAILLGPSEREAADVAAAIATARETLTRLGAAPFLARLELAVAGGSPPADRDAAPGRSVTVTRVRSGLS
jgi:tetratricopeptide (TPR) repeat protein